MKNKKMEELLQYYNTNNEYGKLLGKQLDIISEGHIRYQLVVKPEFQALPGVAHGGLMASMMDGLLGVAALSKVASDGKFVSTVEFKINFFKPIKVGDLLFGEGTVIQAGKSILVAEAWIKVKDEMVAKGMGTLKSYPAHLVY